MIPKTRTEIEVMALSRKLKPISKETEDWLYRHAYQPEILHGGKKFFCSECGTTLAVKDGKKSTTCPFCGARLRPANGHSNGCTYDDKRLVQVMTTCKGWQVIRTYIITKKVHWRHEPSYHMFECHQDWIAQDGSRKIIAKSRCMMPWWSDMFKEDSDMELRRVSWSSNYSFSPWATRIFSITPELKRMGFKLINDIVRPSELCREMLKSPVAEALMKTKQYAALTKLVGGDDVAKYYNQIRICTRHHYIIKDFGLWRDTIDLLEWLGMDTRNPVYICNPDIKSLHDKLNDRYTRLVEKKRREDEIKKAIASDPEYKKAKSMFFGIMFGDSNITIAVIQSVPEMLDEATYMHHCVYSGEYYKRQNSLILSAKDNDGKRVETIEVNTRNFDIVQSQGRFNKPTEFHDEIIQLVKDNMWRIQQVVQHSKAD